MLQDLDSCRYIVHNLDIVVKEIQKDVACNVTQRKQRRTLFEPRTLLIRVQKPQVIYVANKAPLCHQICQYTSVFYMLRTGQQFFLFFY